MKKLQTVIARKNPYMGVKGVILRLSKDECGKAFARMLRVPQHDTAFWFMIVVIPFLFLSLNALAQSKDIMRKDTMVRLINSDTSAKSKPLIVVDGIIYNGDWKSINPSDILSVTVLKNIGATKIYGPQGVNGAILIQTKQYKVPIYRSKPLDSAVNKDAMYVVDGVVSPNKLDGIDPQNILSITILKYASKDPSMANPADKGAVITVTKQGAVKSYQKKFGAFSKEYKSYFDNPQKNDSDFLYLVNGIPVDIGTNEGIKKLFDIQTQKIKEVIFKDKYSIMGNIKPIVAITTKDKH